MSQLQKWSTLIGAAGIALVVGAFLLGVVTQTRRDVLLLLGGIGIVLVGFYILTRPRDATRQKANLRAASEGANVLVFALAFIGIIIAVNYIVERQFKQRLDLTANRQHTLSEQTVNVLAGLEEPVQVTGFFTPQTLLQRQQAETLLKNYLNKSDKLIVQYVDPDENPTLAQKYDNVLPGTLVFEKSTRTEKVYEPFDENKFTNAILKVTQTQQPAVYFTTGHGEYNPTNYDVAGMGAIADFLKDINYKVEPLNLATLGDTAPDDARAIVIAGPTQKFSEQDEKILDAYLARGGRVLFMADPNTDVGLDALLKTWGLTRADDLILDPALNYRGNLPVPVFLQFPYSPITRNLENYGVYLPGTSSFQKDEASSKILTALLTTSPEACAKTDFEKLQTQTQITCDAGDAPGPFVVAYAVEGAGGGGASSDARGRLIALGNASFVTNRWMNNQDALGNQQMFANMINWLAGQEQLIAIPPRDSSVRPLTALSGNEVNLVFWTSVALVPLAALLIGGILWWRRR